MHDPGGAVAVQPPPVRGDKQRSCGALPGGQVDGAGGAGHERDGDDLAALAGDDQGAVPAFQAELPDVRAGRLGDPQPVQRQQRDEGMLGGRPETGGDQDGAELIAVQRGGVRLIIKPGTADVRRRGMLEKFFLDAPAPIGAARFPCALKDEDASRAGADAKRSMIGSRGQRFAGGDEQVFPFHDHGR